MQTLVKTGTDSMSSSFPSLYDYTPAFLDANELLERIKDWESHGEKGADIASRVVYFFCIRRVLETDHPLKPKGFTSTDASKVVAESDKVRDFKGTDAFGRETYPYRKQYNQSLSRLILKWFPSFLSEALRACAVKQHARGMSTVNVVKHILSPARDTPNVFFYFSKRSAVDTKKIVEWLTPRLAYLKIGASSFPQKYRELWESEREAYLDEISDVPLTNTTEQVKALSELYLQLDDALNASETEKGKALLAKSMVSVMSGLFTLTREINVTERPNTPK